MKCCVSKDTLRNIRTKVGGECHASTWEFNFEGDGLLFAHHLIAQSAMPIYACAAKCSLSLDEPILDLLLTENDKNYFTFTFSDEFNGIAIGAEHLTETQVSAILENPSAYSLYRITVFGPGINDTPSPMEIKC